ncbi:helix-turn-helix domain-containing protein [Sessilibacter corallicola]|uniref:helix-turn-helix domain-containing protein n=1 Tax=Sessilibacter corallicola TaxID=2904075 RepID=UPI001E2AB87A|nr:helix-turn-helix domain-containing protein [Sessilibacter corallicola]MCE2027667.1 helix-turn-helix domain-containing protein [Sessilibacter corallicola]
MESFIEKNSSVLVFNAPVGMMKGVDNLFAHALEKLAEHASSVSYRLEISKASLDELGISKEYCLLNKTDSCSPITPISQKNEITVCEKSDKLIFTHYIEQAHINNALKAKKTFPLRIYGQVVGSLVVNEFDFYADTNLDSAVTTAIKEIESSIECQSVRARVEKQFNAYWYGTSLALLETRQNCRLFSKLPMPVFISGAPGSGKLIAAYSVHCHSNPPDSPFITIDCAVAREQDFSALLSHKLSDANHGSLYIRGVEKLTSADLIYLLDIIRTTNRNNMDAPFHVRIFLGITDSNNEYDNLTQLEEIEFYCLRLKMPCLQERWPDVSFTIEAFKQLGVIHQKFELTDDAWSVISDYSWPGGFGQFEAFLKKADLLAVDHLVNVNTLRKYFPNIEAVIKNNTNVESSNNKKTTIEAVMAGEVVCHPALQRACEYIHKNFQQSITMSELAQHSYISSSHLSSLFKKELSQPFKQVLNEYRVHLAKSFISESLSKQITVIAQDVGFSDFSHFEKTFKKNVGVSPGTYRNKFRMALSTNQ